MLHFLSLQRNFLNVSLLYSKEADKAKRRVVREKSWVDFFVLLLPNDQTNQNNVQSLMANHLRNFQCGTINKICDG